MAHCFDTASSGWRKGAIQVVEYLRTLDVLGSLPSGDSESARRASYSDRCSLRSAVDEIEVLDSILRGTPSAGQSIR